MFLKFENKWTFTWNCKITFLRQLYLKLHFQHSKKVNIFLSQAPQRKTPSEFPLCKAKQLLKVYFSLQCAIFQFLSCLPPRQMKKSMRSLYFVVQCAAFQFLCFGNTVTCWGWSTYYTFLTFIVLKRNFAQPKSHSQNFFELSINLTPRDRNSFVCRLK